MPAPTRSVPTSGSRVAPDRHAIMVDDGTCVLYELFAARWNGGDPRAGSGAIFDLASNDLRPAGWTSADAAGLPILPGLIRDGEVFGSDPGIDHALRFTVSCTNRHYVWPARHQAGVRDDRCPPMGARSRLRGGYDVSGYSTRARIVLKAMKRFGLIVVETGAPGTSRAASTTAGPTASWTSSSGFRCALVAVDESACKVSGDSAAFAYGPGCPAP